MKRVLITGASGLIGKAVLARLEQSGKYELITTGRDVAAKHPFGKNSTFAELDLAVAPDLEAMRKSCGTIDAMIHIAAAISKNDQDEALIPVNCGGVLHCVKLAFALDAKRFVFLSSIGVIGTPQVLPVTEMHPVIPRSLYHATKLFGEQVLQLTENSQLHPIILRISSPVGPGMRRGSIVPVFLEKAAQNKSIILHGKGEREQNYIDVRDIAKAIELALQSRVVGIYNIAAKKSVSNRELAEYCKAVCHTTSMIRFSGQEDPEEALRWHISIDKAQAHIGFFPRYSIEESLVYALAGATASCRHLS